MQQHFHALKKEDKNVKQGDVMKTWKELAWSYYFESHMSINDIAVATGVSRQSISVYLKNCDGFSVEKQKRKNENLEKRKIYKREKNREYQSAARMPVTAESMRREHDLAALELSHEIYH